MWTDKLRELDACDPAISWASQYPTAQQAWEACERPDWMIWLIDETGMIEKCVLWRAAVRFARLVEHLMEDERSRHALHVREAWLDGHATDDEMAAARDAAAAVWAAADATEAAIWATEATTRAARAAAGAARAATWAAWAAARYAAGTAARYAAEAAGDDIYRRCADILRELIPVVPLEG